MAARLPSSPPVLPGFTHVHILGTGGFADVFLYEQNLPRRPVAVKVIHADLVDDRVRSAFRTEVNLMGRLSAHPSILTVYSASVSGDGRPYLVMELCSTEIGDRFRQRPLELDEALDVMVRVGGALETAHRAGTLHRDVKPANILTTAFGHPVLSDFGIASNMHLGDHESAGVSVPWSAPEVLRDETAGTVASEVWSFGATLYSLVAGRSPAEIRGGRNGTDELSARILTHDIQPFDVDAPRALATIVRKALSKDPADRYHAILPMVQDLQAVQEEMGVPITAIDLQERPWSREVESAEEVEREEALPLRVRAARRRAPVRGAQQIDISSSTQSATPPTRRGLVSVLVGAATAVVLGAVAVVAVAVTTIQGSVPVVDEVVAEPVDGAVAFAWDDPGLVGSDSYLVTTASGDAVIQRASTFRLSGAAGDELCITVSVNRDGRSGDAAEACGTVP